MYDVLRGVRVVEVAAWVFVPTAGSVLAEWGAEVIKVEHPVTGDPVRGMTNAFNRGATINIAIEQTNRGKRSIAVDISKPEGREVLYKLVKTADVFLTSFMEDTRRELKIDADHIRAQNPSIIYVRGTGYGSRGPAATQGSFDLAAAWARSGVAYQMTPPGEPPPMQPASVGDVCGGLTAAGGIAAALYRRSQTGEGAVVEVSLYGMGMWLMSQAISAASLGFEWPYRDRANPHHALVNYFRTKDDRWIALVMGLQAARWWGDLCVHLGRDDLTDDPRFNTDQARAENVAECTRVLDEIFATRTFVEWQQALATAAGVWAPVLSPAEVGQDPQVEAMGYFPEVKAANGQTYRAVSTPVQYDDRAVEELKHAPEFGSATEEVLLELDYTWDDISQLKDAGAVL